MAERTLKQFVTEAATTKDDENLPGLQEKDWAGIIGFTFVVGVLALAGLSALTGKTVPALETLITVVSLIITFYFGRKL